MRGQTTLDFAVGAVIFVGVVGFVFLFISSAVTPFTGNPQDGTVAANRVADELAGDQLGSPADPYVLDTFCTRDFFTTLPGGSASSQGECAYDATNDLNDRVGIPARQDVNVTIVGNLTGPPTDTDTPVPLCWDEDDRRLVNATDGSTTCDVKLTAGPNPTGEDSTITARRAVSLAGRDAILVVEVW